MKNLNNQVKKQLCIVCASPSKHHCPKCKTLYCSKDCQRADWKAGHKSACKQLTADYERLATIPKKKKDPPVVMLPENNPAARKLSAAQSRFLVEQEKTADKNQAWRGTCGVCLELLPIDLSQKCYFPCCNNFICKVCSIKCATIGRDDRCPLCRASCPASEAEYLAMLQKHVNRGDPVAQEVLSSLFEIGSMGLKKNAKRAVQL